VQARLSEGKSSPKTGAPPQDGRVTTASAHEPPFALDGTVTRDKLLELLAVQTELSWLDYKEVYDLSGAEGQVKLARHAGAMMIDGGYIVVGADDNGVPVGLTDQQASHYDEAKLSGKLAKYLPPGFEIRSALHEIDLGASPEKLAVVWVAPHPDGWCVFARNGEYQDKNGKQTFEFREGDVYARHGSRSEKWEQADIQRVRRRLVAREKEAWRAERAEEFRRLEAATSAQASATAASATYTWQLDAEAFEAATVEMLRRDDDVPVRRMLRIAQRDAKTFQDAGNDQELATLLDRVAALVALALDLQRPQFFDFALACFSVVLEQAVAERYVPGPQGTSTPVPDEVVALRGAERLYAVGALAVRLRYWAAVRQLALMPMPTLQERSSSRTWHRYALTRGHQEKLFKQGSLLLFARAVAAEHQVLRPDLPGNVVGEPDRLLTSICEFDLLATVISGVEAEAANTRDLLTVSYPNFALLDVRAAAQIVRRVIAPGPDRELLVGDATDEEVATVLYLTDQVAQQEAKAVFGWEGYPADVADWVVDEVRESDSELFD
jgi:hypothetical protein